MQLQQAFSVAILLGALALRPTVSLGQDNSVGGTYNGDPLCRNGPGVYPHPTYHPDPDYDDKARKKKIQGTVVLTVIVTKEGRTADLKVAKTLTPGLDEQAMKAVSRWKFDPVVQDGKPCPTRINVEVQFKLY